MSYDHTKKTINGYSYYLTQRIGSGCSSQVYRGIHDKTNEEVAIKVVNKIPQKGAENIQMAETQIKCLQLLKGTQNILQLQHVIQSKNNIYIITELCKKGTLADLLTAKKKLPETTVISFICKIINGFKSIAAHKLVHRDLKPMNIFITQTFDLKIGDFGFSIDQQLCEQPLKENVGSPLYMPLQTLKNNQYSYKSDIWAIGIIFLELITGRNPWKSKTQSELIKQLEGFNEADIIPTQIGTSSKEFLRGCLKKHIHDRFNLKQLLTFNFYQQAEKRNQLQIPSLLKLKNTLSPNTKQTKSTSILKVQQPHQSNKITVCSEVMHKSSKNLLEVQPKCKGVSEQVNKSLQRAPIKLNQNEDTSKLYSEQSTSNEECSIKVSLIDNKHTKSKQKDINSASAFFIPNKIEIQSTKLDKSQVVQSIMKKPSKTENALEDNKCKLDQINEKLNKLIDRNNYASTTTNHELTVKHEQNNIAKSFLSNSANKHPEVVQQTESSSKQKISLAQKQILLQVQGQINYFRFLYKLFKKLHDILKTSDQKIFLFKSNLLFMTYQKIEEIKQLKNITQVNWAQRKQFQNTPQYVNLLDVLKKYKERYNKQTEKDNIKLTPSREKDFISLTTHVMKILYQNVLKIQLNEEELNKKKSLVFILQDLIHLSRIYMLQIEGNWHSFYNKSQIGSLVQASPPLKIDNSYWKKVKNSFLELVH